MRSSATTGLRRRVLVRGRLRAGAGGALTGRRILAQQRLHVDGATYRTIGTVSTGARGAFSVRIPAGGSRVLRVTSPGTGGLQARLRTLRLHVPWSSSLTVRPRRPRRGGVIRLSGRLRLGASRCRSRASWSSCRRSTAGAGACSRRPVPAARAPRGRTSYRFGSRPGSYRIRARIRREGTIPYDLGYSRPVRVTVR